LGSLRHILKFLSACPALETSMYCTGCRLQNDSMLRFFCYLCPSAQVKEKKWAGVSKSAAHPVSGLTNCRIMCRKSTMHVHTKIKLLKV
jgi:hypothetical protein